MTGVEEADELLRPSFLPSEGARLWAREVIEMEIETEERNEGSDGKGRGRKQGNKDAKGL